MGEEKGGGGRKKNQASAGSPSLNRERGQWRLSNPFGKATFPSADSMVDPRKEIKKQKKKEKDEEPPATSRKGRGKSLYRNWSYFGSSFWAEMQS